MHAPLPYEVGGYVLAGGRSSRMGQDKALLQLGGKPLVRHAVKKLRRVCMDVRVLSNNPALAEYAPVVPDLHPDCGPMSAMEAGLLHSIFEWNLFLAVDMPFVPSALLSSLLRTGWRTRHLDASNTGPSSRRLGERVRMFRVDGRAQPGFCMVHKEVAPFLTAALERGHYKLMPVLEEAAKELAVRRGYPAGSGFWCLPLIQFNATRGEGKMEAWCYTTEAQQAAFSLWFANLNTPEDFAEAELHLSALDT